MNRSKIPFKCLYCGTEYSEPADCAGRSAKCLRCNNPITVPGETAWFGYFVGQDELRGELTSKIASAREKKCRLPHLLFCAPPAWGKRTLATLTALALGVTPQEASAEAWRKRDDIVPFVTKMEEGGILIVNDIHSLRGEALVFFLAALYYNVDIELGKGMNARTINLSLKPFTVIGTTARCARVDDRLCRRLRARDFKPYSQGDLDLIVVRMLRNVNITASVDVARLITFYSGGRLENASDIVAGIQTHLGRAETHSTLDRIRRFFSENDQHQIPLSVDRTKEILDFLGYKRDERTSVGIACEIRSFSNGEEFEEYVGEVFRGLRYEVEFTPRTGDHGIDLILQRGNQKAVVQCKHWKGSVGEPEVRDFLGSMTAMRVKDMRVKDGFFITTGKYTDQAIEFGKQNGIKLLDLDGLLNLAQKAGQV